MYDLHKIAQDVKAALDEGASVTDLAIELETLNMGVCSQLERCSTESYFCVGGTLRNIVLDELDKFDGEKPVSLNAYIYFLMMSSGAEYVK